MKFIRKIIFDKIMEETTNWIIVDDNCTGYRRHLLDFTLKFEISGSRACRFRVYYRKYKKLLKLHKLGLKTIF